MKCLSLCPVLWAKNRSGMQINPVESKCHDGGEDGVSDPNTVLGA